MKDVAFECTCPYCGKVNTKAGSVDNKVVMPKEGDVTLCIDCGNCSFVKKDAPGGMAKLDNHAQLVELCTQHPSMIGALRAWWAVRQKQGVH